ncbi:MAG: lamin tail domain-containing protein, partial [Thermoanaerobaculia bacterium]
MKLRLLALIAPGLAGPLSAGGPSVVISEVHYHSPAETAAGDPLEFIELSSLAGEPSSLAGWTLEGGIEFSFPAQAVIEPHGYLVVARDAGRIEADHGITGVLGSFTGRLPNGRGRISLRDRDGALVDRVAYRDEDPWPENPDGLGPSLEKTDLLQDGENQASWRASILPGGTPGQRNSTDRRLSSRTLISPGAVWR